MNVEIRKVANGFLVFPERYDRRGDFNIAHDENIYVFSNYHDLMEGLLDVLTKSVVDKPFSEKK